MELKILNQSQPLPSIGAATAAARALSADAQAVIGKVSEAAHDVSEHVAERGTDAINQAKQQVSEIYDQTSKRVSEQYEKAVEYGHDNPGVTTLIALGVGIGIGLLLGGSLSTLCKRVAS